MVPWLNDELRFPAATSGVQEGPLAGLVAIGGDFSVERLILAYSSGIFPWSVSPITWWAPDPRAIFEWDHFHIPRSFRRTLNQAPYEITRDKAFPEVIHACATQRAKGNWITPEFIRAYIRLHQAGYAHSVECWQSGTLVGGIYGVAIGGFFAGESMFHRADDASKVALHHLFHHLKTSGYQLFDIQMVTNITRQFGATTIPLNDFLTRLNLAIQLPVKF